MSPPYRPSSGERVELSGPTLVIGGVLVVVFLLTVLVGWALAITVIIAVGAAVLSAVRNLVSWIDYLSKD